ncbi:hypothetical protein MPOCJGCO_1806 [Methylobacterium trifolii]|uniref:Four helix bundle protein n=2 Tax=Methylobacterium trifolii TaxID=1003092 RepID=A0ABQ4TYU7_9HYPH|nr:hypothetical protein MPOCJGCO_1806 [Methylobacterium trifolii]
MTLAESCYAFTKPFPREEAFGITSQIRRSAVSVAANIAEGHGRESTAAFIQFLRIAQGSLKELETHVLLAGRVGLAPMDTSTVIVGRCEALGRQLRGLIRALQRRAINEKGAR